MNEQRRKEAVALMLKKCRQLDRKVDLNFDVAAAEFWRTWDIKYLTKPKRGHYAGTMYEHNDEEIYR
jgi:hypothetical protein